MRMVILIYFGKEPYDIIKHIEHTEDCEKWPFDFVRKLNRSITQIAKINLNKFPEIELQTEEDRVLRKLLRKNDFFAFGTNLFFDNHIAKINHVIAYMERDVKIYTWNGDFVINVQQEVKRVKAFLL